VGQGTLQWGGFISFYELYKCDIESKNNFQTGVMSSDSIYEILTSNGLRRT